MKMFNCVLDGDNFIGIAICKTKEEAIKMGSKYCWGGTPNAMELPYTKYGERNLKDIDNPFFVSQEFIGDDMAQLLGYEDVNHICLGIK